MRCYLITAAEGESTIATRYAGTNALAKEARDELVSTFALKKKDVTIEQHEVPVAKDELIAYLNKLVVVNDKQVEA